ncbi:MAG: hypothetical protein K2K54_07955, partial [Lachnospiraceae bacterium]|nr:hypothetical protein [Lachnospiraceae bacterium]
MKKLLKFITCGSVDDGKSTLIGHMLYDARLLYTDQKRTLELESRMGGKDGELDYSLLLDGLLAEREQGITIDVAYRYFHTKVRNFIAADTPGHEEYTRNMAVGASYAELALILVDASKGILVQTKRHTRICSLMGIRHFVFAVNKMDLLSYDQERFLRLERELKELLGEFEYESAYILPVSATKGDNITKRSKNMPWFEGCPLLEYLEQADVSFEGMEEGFIFPVQRVVRTAYCPQKKRAYEAGQNINFRGFQGQIESGSIHIGEEVTVLPSGEKARVKEILVADRRNESAVSGQPVTLQLDREMDVSRGCVLVKGAETEVSSMCTAVLLWMDQTPLVSGKNYYIKLGTKMLPATVMSIKYRIDVNTGTHIPAENLAKNEIACCDLVFSEKTVFTSFRNNKA